MSFLRSITRTVAFLAVCGATLFQSDLVAQPAATEASVTNSSPQAVGSETLEFTDGSVLHGTLQTIDRERGLTWQHPEAIQPLRFSPQELQQIRFYQHSTATQVALPCRFRFRNGDELYGELTSLDDTSARVNTRFGKNLRVERSALRSIAFLSKHFSMLYEGPTGLDGWSTGRGGQPWRYREGAFIAEHVGSIGRNFQLPSASNIEFDVEWEGQLGLIVQAYTENVDRFDYSSASYMLYVNATSIGMQRVSPETGISNLGNAQLPESARRNNFHLELRASREEATLAVYVNGQLLQKWKDNSGFAAKGSGVLFFSQHEGPRLKLSNIKVSEWDGKFEDSNVVAPKLTQDHLLLANRDKVDGEIVQLSDGKLKITTAETPLDVPLSRVSEIHFADSDSESTPRSPWYVRASLTGGEKLSFELEQWSADRITGTNASFGRMQLSPKNIRGLEFNYGRRVAQNGETGKPEAEGGNEKQDLVMLRNGDTLSGTLKSLNPKASVRLSRSNNMEDVEFKVSALTEVRLHRKRQPGTNTTEVSFINGDQLLASVTDISHDKIVADTWYAGRLELPRDTVQMLVPSQDHQAPIYSGPDGLQNWIMGAVTVVNDAGEWSYEDGAFYATKAASVARDLKLPDLARLEFDIAWKGTLQMAVALYTSRMQPINLANKDTEPDFGGFYSLQLGSLSAGLLMVKKDAPINYLWQMATPLLGQKNQAHVEVRVDKNKKLIALLIDGVIVKQSVDPDGFAGSGTAVRFVHQGLGTLRLSNLKVSEWDGLFEEPYSNKTGTEDLVRLRNGDRVQGKVENLKDGQLVIATDAGKLRVPWQRVKQLEHPGKNLREDKPEPINAIGYLGSGAQLKFQLEAWDEKGIRLNSSQFGTATFDPAAFQQIRFNLKP